MRSALFIGREHSDIGTIDLVGEGPCAIAISRGGAVKTYSHTEPNEDACGFAWGPGGTLLAVADGHHGATGAEIAVRHLIEDKGLRWTDSEALEAETLLREARESVAEINLAIFAEADRCALPPSPTTLCFALLRPAEKLLLHASIGDSHIFWTRDDAPVDLAWAAHNGSHPTYIGRKRDLDLASACTIACEPLEASRAVVLVTDGFSEDGIGHAAPADVLAEIQSSTLVQDARLRPVETCRGVAESAMAIQRKNRAGDNIGCAVWTAD
ncbi:MAG: protein phosphatase 2C domain-containing protein [bacterium]|nr:protein phosphatase 2C domain-containing protein [bacterium]